MSDEGTKVQRVYRLAPCPYYDVEGMESWLSDMAQEGLLLSKDGFFAEIATFERGSPQSMKYRLEAAPKSTSIWSDNGGQPDEEAVAISQKYGWEYIAKRGSFYVYRSAEPGARELNTDPEVQAIALQAVSNKERSAVLSSLFWLFLYPLLRMRGILVLTMINLRTWYFLIGAGIVLWLFAGSVVRAVHLGKLRKKLLTKGLIDHHKDWRKRASRYQVANAVLGVLVVIWLGILLHGWSASIMDQDKLPLTDYTGAPPFATISDFAPGGEYSLKTFGLANTVKEWTDWLAPRSIEWEEIATVKRPDGSDLAGGLYVDYHETISPWLARVIAYEYQRADKLGKHAERLALPELGVDYAVGYLDRIKAPTIVMQNGSKVIHVTFYQTSSTYTMPFAEWAGVMAASIR